jgi:hypothetical protein
MRKFFFVTVYIFLFFFIFAQTPTPTNEKIIVSGKSSNSLSDVYEKYGVEIITDTKKMIPQSWIDSPVNGKAKSLSSDLYDKAAKMIVKALKEYPKDFLLKNLKGIAIVDRLEFYGVEYGGTAAYEYKILILEIKDWSDENWVISTIHHEFNHLLVYWNKFPESVWSSYNKKGFNYGNGGVDAIKNGMSSTDRVESAFRDGFANQYGKSAFVEDVATITEYAIGDRADFQTRALKYPIIFNKFETLKKFYRSLDPYFTDEFWSGKKSNTDTKENTIIKNDTKDNIRSRINDEKETVNISFYSYTDPYNFEKVLTKNETYIAYYFEIDNTGPQYESVDVTATYYYPDGSLLGEFTNTYEPEDDIIKCTWGFGWKSPGNWKNGKYKVILNVNDEYYGTGYFNVK